VPALAGLAAPWWRSEATASLHGMTLSTDRAAVVAAVLRGVAATVVDLLDVVADDLGAPVARLRVDGGLTRSHLLMQAQADLAQVPVDVYPSPDATALGAAAAAVIGLDPSRPVADAVGGWRPAATYEPQWSADRAADHLGRWRAAVARGLEDR
jgi:glycerol kinase